MTGQQLKNSILQMAIQGKLVPQNPDDEQAFILLERIRKEKEKLIREKKIKADNNSSRIFRGVDGLFYEKKGRNLPVLIQDEIPFDIPESWEWVRFSDIVILISGQDMAAESYNAKGKGIPYITGASNIDNGRVIINRWTEYPKTIASKGDILLTCKGTVGTLAILDEEMVHIARQIMAIRVLNGIERSYVYIVLMSFVEQLKAVAKSMIPGIARNDVLSSLVALPPLVEQNRIVDRLNEVLPLVEEYGKLEKELNDYNASFPEQMKKSILQYAVEGRLVSQNPEEEPASVLLERIRSEKKKLVKRGAIKKDKKESVILRRDGSFFEKIAGKERCIDDEIPFDIPESWEWVRLGTLFQHNTGKALNSSKQEGELLKYITTSNVYWDHFELSNLKLMRFTKSEKEKCTVIKGDLLVCEGGDVGRASIWPYDEVIRIQNHIHKLRPYGVLSVEFFYYIFFLYKHSGLIGGKGIGIQGLSSGVIHDILFPFPPYEEQKRIVDKINEVLPLIEKFGKC